MHKNTGIIRVYTGSEVLVGILKVLLNEVGISSIIKDDFSSSISAGFVGGTPSALDLYIQENDKEKADLIIDDFLKNNG